MKILCIHFKGGVGKSTTAVHALGVLSTLEGKTLLVDGDRQVTSYCFFNGGMRPSSDEEHIISDNLSLITLYPAEPITGHLLSRRIRKIQKIPYNHLVVDTTPDPAVTNQLIAEVDPDLVLIPIRFDDAGAHAQLAPLLETISRMRAVGVNPRVKIIPLGGNEETIRDYIPDVELDYEISDTIPALAEVFGNAVYRDFDFAWNYQGCDHLYGLYHDIVMG